MGKEPSYVRTFSNNTALSSTSQGKILVPGTQTGCFFWVNDRYVVLAKGMSVFKASGGMNYVHGGYSPQELLVPSLFISTKTGYWE